MPVYNEETTIFSILNSLPNKSYIEIIVVDDHSIDNSISEIKRAQKGREIKLYKHKRNKGYGEAILTGIRKAKGKIIITMDADGQHRSSDLYNLIKPIINGEADFTIGSRYLGSYHYNLPISTRIGEILIEKLLILFFRTRIKNNQGGFRAFNKNILYLFNDIQFKNYAFTTEIIIRAILNGYKIIEVPISLLDRIHGKSRIILNKLAFNLFLVFFRYILLKIRMKIYRKEGFKLKQNPIIFREIV